MLVEWQFPISRNLVRQGVQKCVEGKSGYPTLLHRLYVGLYLDGGFERGGVRVVRQALAITLLFNTQQVLDILTVLIAAGLLITLHPRLDLVLPQRRVLCWLLLWSGTLRKQKTVQLLWYIWWYIGQVQDSVQCCVCELTFTLEDFLDPSRKACQRGTEIETLMLIEDLTRDVKCFD